MLPKPSQTGVPGSHARLGGLLIVVIRVNRIVLPTLGLANLALLAVLAWLPTDGRSLAVTFGISGVATAGREDPRPGPHEDPDDRIVAGTDRIVSAPASRQPPRVVRTTLGRGATLDTALGRVGVPEDKRPRVIRAAGRYLDLRRLPAQAGIAAVEVVENAGGTSTRILTFRAEPGRYLRLTFPVDPTAEPRAEMIRLPVVTTLETAGGVVRSSVAQALSENEHGLPLTLAFADIFQWDVDLLIDPRSGDTVRIVYEAQRLGQTPEDLPRFGGAAFRPGDFLGLGRVLAASYEGRMARSTGFWVAGTDSAGSYFDADGEPLRKAFLKSPLNYRRISSRFSTARRHPVTRKVVPHHGIDFAAAAGTPVVATSDGRVVSARWDGSLGRAVRVRHGSEYITVYGHLSGFARGIRAGVEVRQNQIIGFVGSTGRATGPHLHYTMIRSGRPVDPFQLKNPPTEPLPPEAAPRLAASIQRWLPRMEAIAVDTRQAYDRRRRRDDGVAVGL